MRLIFFGDVVGRPGRALLCKKLGQLKREHTADVVIVEGENSAGGFGITAEIAEEILAAGADAITLGNHAFNQVGFDRDIAKFKKICRPLNLEHCSGNTEVRVERNGYSMAITTVLGRTFMDQQASCPFIAIDNWIDAQMKRDPKTFLFVDVHAETTAEKGALGYYLDGRVCAVVGTHTHVPTADAHILPKGTAFITDVGMCGALNSVLGFEPRSAIAQFTLPTHTRLEVSKAEPMLQYVVIDVEESKARSIQHHVYVEK